MGKNPFIDVSLAVKFLAHGGRASFDTFLEQRPEPDEENLREACDNFMNDARRGEVEIISNGKAINPASLAGDNLFIDVKRNSICTAPILSLEKLLSHPSPQELSEAMPWYINEYLPSKEPWTNLKVLSSEIIRFPKNQPIEAEPAKKAPRPASEAEAKKYLIELSRKNGNRIPPRDVAEKDAVLYFEELGKQLSSTVWRNAHRDVREGSAKYGLIPLKSGRKRRVQS